MEGFRLKNGQSHCYKTKNCVRLAVPVGKQSHCEHLIRNPESRVTVIVVCCAYTLFLTSPLYYIFKARIRESEARLRNL